MIVKIDASVVTADGAAIGMVDGVLDLVAIPQIGSTISLARPQNEGVLPISRFAGHLQVKNVIYSPVNGGIGVIVMLEDIVAENSEHSKRIMEYLEKGFGLLATEYEA